MMLLPDSQIMLTCYRCGDGDQGNLYLIRPHKLALCGACYRENLQMANPAETAAPELVPA